VCGVLGRVRVRAVRGEGDGSMDWAGKRAAGKEVVGLLWAGLLGFGFSFPFSISFVFLFQTKLKSR
jgi:hypothetical protein